MAAVCFIAEVMMKRCGRCFLDTFTDAVTGRGQEITLKSRPRKHRHLTLDRGFYLRRKTTAKNAFQLNKLGMSGGLMFIELKGQRLRDTLRFLKTVTS